MLSKKTKKRLSNNAKTSLAAAMRELIKKGKTNEEVLRATRRRFGPRVVTDEKKHWPQWYRRDLVKKREIAKRFAEMHQH